VTCPDVQALLHGYLDGELDLMSALRLERHLQDCPACREAYHGQRALQGALRAAPLRWEAPPALEGRVRSVLRESGRPPLRVLTPGRKRLGLAAAAAALLALAGWALARTWMTPGADDLLAQEVVASHVRALMAEHLVDVPSSDRHTVKPWFQGRLNFPPEVPDLEAEGFRLVGGRLDYLAERPVAALVYRRHKHVINLFTWPAAGSDDQAPRAATRQNQHVVRWAQRGMNYWAVSDLNAEELQQFAQAVREAVGR
jgi:anti-sigma factor RsiW